MYRAGNLRCLPEEPDKIRNIDNRNNLPLHYFVIFANKKWIIVLLTISKQVLGNEQANN